MIRDVFSSFFLMPLRFAEAGANWLRDATGPNAPRPAEAASFAATLPSGRSPASQPLMVAGSRTPVPVGVAPVPAGPVLPVSLLTPRAFHLGKLDPTTTVVIGDALAAGLNGFALRAESQAESYPAQLARHLGVAFRIPHIQSPGLVEFRAGARVHLPLPGQTTVLADFPPSGPFSNLSVPGFTVSDALQVRPRPPLIHPHDARQTAANLLLAPQALIEGKCNGRQSQLECALEQRPTFLIVALGYSELIELLRRGEAGRTDVSSFARDYERILSAAARSGTSIVVTTVPDPRHAACVSSVEAASRLLSVPPTALLGRYSLRKGDRLTLAGLYEIGCQIQQKTFISLDERCVIRAERVERAGADARAVNDAIEHLGRKHGATICDVAGVFRRLYDEGITVGPKRISADYLGGFYSLNGYTPGPAGHALIANEVVRAINEGFGAEVLPIDVNSWLAADPVADFRRAEGSEWPLNVFGEPTRPLPSPARSAPPSRTWGERPRGAPDDPEESFVALEERYNSVYRATPSSRLRLPDGLTQELQLVESSSYYGDAIRAVNCSGGEPFADTGCPAPLFGGLATFAGNLSGSVRITFSEPVGDSARFEVQFARPLSAADGRLTAPEVLRIPALRGVVDVWPGAACVGVLDLLTGETSDLDLRFRFANSALEALIRVNPDFPNAPIQYPGRYGTAVARFTQRDDGILDFVFSGTAFVPLGPQARFPLPFPSASNDFPSIPAAGTALHPHLHLSTVDLTTRPGSVPLEWPSSTVVEFTASGDQTCFGDDFTLNTPELGFARGRSYLSGRALIQFGERSGTVIPFVVSTVPPAGLLIDQDIAPIQSLFPGRLDQGLIGHDSVLRFPARTYRTNDLYLLDDPFDIAWGAMDSRTGAVIGDLLHRALFGQNVFLSLIRIEPRTPKGSFEYRGPASFETTRQGGLRYRFNGSVTLPYPAGYLFPKPNLAAGVVVGEGSRLDPFFQLDATADSAARRTYGRIGNGTMLVAATGDQFSYRYSLGRDASQEPSFFEYTNHSQGGTFRMTSLAFVDFTALGGRASERTTGLVSFSGFGTWSLDRSCGLHPVSVQVSTDPKLPYVSILVGGGPISNVDTPPPHARPPLTQLNSEAGGLGSFRAMSRVGGPVSPARVAALGEVGGPAR